MESRHPEFGPQMAAVLRAEIVITPDCMNLIDLSPWQDRLREAYRVLAELDQLPSQSADLPASVPHPLDDAVISLSAQLFARHRSIPFDTVRAAFVEGAPLFTQSALYDRAHVQIAVRDLSLIRQIRRVERE